MDGETDGAIALPPVLSRSVVKFEATYKYSVFLIAVNKNNATRSNRLFV